MRLAEKAEDISLDDDPRPLDRVLFNRIKLLVEHEAIDRAWGCVLYRLHRLGRIDNDAREAGDRYWKIVDDHWKYQATDPDEAGQAVELAYRRVNRAKRRFKEATGVLGIHRKAVDSVVMSDEWPTSERAHKLVRNGLDALKIFFATGTKHERGPS